jgi:aryl-alcohol dehydrogenase-like predicted oxidoreductase
MQTRKLGNSDLQITPVGYGAWAVGGSGWQFAWGSQDDNDSIAAIHRALELGVNWIDTAAVYGLGHCEDIVGRAIKSWQGPKPYIFNIFTKCSLRWEADGQVQKVLSPDSIRREVEDSLRRLSVVTTVGSGKSPSLGPCTIPRSPERLSALQCEAG